LLTALLLVLAGLLRAVAPRAAFLLVAFLPAVSILLRLLRVRLTLL
jgi:hypothetical protein